MRYDEAIRQGDFLLIPLDTAAGECIPTEAVAEVREGGRAIVGRGEATGHHHAFVDPAVNIFGTATGRWLDVPQVATLVHEEHGALEVLPGQYVIIQERNFHSGMVKRVTD